MPHSDNLSIWIVLFYLVNPSYNNGGIDLFRFVSKPLMAFLVCIIKDIPEPINRSIKLFKVLLPVINSDSAFNSYWEEVLFVNRDTTLKKG